MKPGIVAAVALLPCVRAALQSCPDLSSEGPEVFDFVVVGSGAGGGPLASRLAENGFSDPTTELAYNIKEFSDPDSRIAWYPRARGLGGSTIHNAMINIIAGTQTDFDGIADDFSDPSWSRSNMQEYFKKIEKNMYPVGTLLTLADHGFNGWLKTTLLPYLNLLHNLDVLDPELLTIFTSFILSPNSPIVDLNSLAADGSEGINSPSFTIDENHIRSSVYNRLTAVQDSTSNLNITFNTLATRILLCQGSDGPTAYGVEIAPGQPYLWRETLKLSGIGNSTELSAFGIETVVNLPGVGTNLQDHDEISVVWKLKDDIKLFDGCTFLSDPAKDPCLRDWIQSNHGNVYAFDPVLDVIITKSNESLPAPDIFTYVAPAYFEGIFRGFSQEVVDNPDGLTAIVLKAHPSSRGFVRLTGSHPQDPLDIEKMHFEAEEGPADVQALVDGIEHIRTFVENSPIAAFILEEALPSSGANLTEYIHDRVFGHHACCTNPIGTDDDPNAVLDKDFHVRGVDRLRVVDMSAWPNVPGYFVTTPMYMISEKAADVIISDANARSSR
ncbi:hypothetical protein B0H13DRAFT_2277862 [Mycena leptocephala]|nr:hypothetical protein B0H13DRAFT_2277862 [Mycena leptocephala]